MYITTSSFSLLSYFLFALGLCCMNDVENKNNDADQQLCVETCAARVFNHVGIELNRRTYDVLRDSYRRAQANLLETHSAVW